MRDLRAKGGGMRLISARAAWHDCYYQQGRCSLELLVDRALWGQVQLSEVDRSLDVIAHQALAGRFQHAIASLPESVQRFGNYLYAPEVSTRASNYWLEGAHDLVWDRWSGRIGLSPGKQQQAYWVVRGVLFRYRAMMQGGMSLNDPLSQPPQFRAWMADNHGVSLDRRNWSRDWGRVIDALTGVCNSVDIEALAPLSRVLREEMGEAA